MAEAIDALHALETQRLDEAERAITEARVSLDAADEALERAERAVLVHDEAERRAREVEAAAGVRSADAFAREDAHRRAMRAHRITLVEASVRALAVRESAEVSLEAHQRALADIRARARAIEARIDAREAMKRKVEEQKLEDEADDRHRR